MATKPSLKPVAAPAVAETAAAAPAKSRLVPLLVALLVTMSLAGGATWFFFLRTPPPAPKKAEASGAPTFVTLEPFTVNLQGGDHFLQIGIVLQVTSDAAAEDIKSHLPLIRNKLLLRLASKTPENIESAQGKQTLIKEILADVREPLRDRGEGGNGGDSGGDRGVEAVLLGSLIVQ